MKRTQVVQAMASGTCGQGRLATAGRVKLAAARFLTSMPIGVAVGRALRHSVPNRGLRFDTTGLPSALNGSLLFGIYESAEVRFVQKYFTGQQSLVELGGSLGIVTSHALRVAGETARLVSVEPRADLIPFLRRNVAAHKKPRQNVSVVQAAVGDTNGPVRLALSARTDSGRVTSSHGAGTVEVPGRRLSSLVEEHGIGEFALISDIEGAERHVLWGDEEALSSCRLVMFELHGSEGEVRRMIERLNELGLTVVDQHGPVVVGRR